MNDYRIIDNLPFGYDFHTKTVKELSNYRAWFIENKLYRLKELNNLVISIPGLDNWEMDFTPNSLIGLWKCLQENITSEPLSKEKYESLQSSVPAEIPVNDYELTTRSISILVDAGIYIGDVLIHNHPSLRWEQYPSRTRNDANYGHMVIVINKNHWVNPIRAMYNIGLKIINHQCGTNSILKLYDFWSSSVNISALSR